MPVIIKKNPTIYTPIASLHVSGTKEQWQEAANKSKTVAEPPKAKLESDVAKAAGNAAPNRERARVNAQRILEIDVELTKVEAEIAEATKVQRGRASELAAEKAELEPVILEDLVGDTPCGVELKVQIDNIVINISKEKYFRHVKDMKLVAQLLGDTVFWSAVQIPLKIIDDYLTLPQRAKVLDGNFNGKRTVTIAPYIKDHL